MMLTRNEPAGDPVPIRRCCRMHEREDLHTEYGAWWPTKTLFVVCNACGNKRCPKATNCANECAGSNKPGQEGSDL